MGFFLGGGGGGGGEQRGVSRRLQISKGDNKN